MGSSLSLTGGSTCATCGNPDPCLHKVIIKDYDSYTHIWPIEKDIHLKVLDDGTGSTGTILVEGKCDKPTCPVATLESQIDNVPIQNDIEDEITLYFKKPSDKTDTGLSIDNIWTYLNRMILPTDATNETPNSYRLLTKGCVNNTNPAKIDVYPTKELRIVVGFEYDALAQERTMQERRNEQIKARKLMEGARPKNPNQLRSGWTLHTDQFKVTQTREINVEFGLKIAGTDYSTKLAEVTKQVRTLKTLEQLGKVDSILNKIKTNLMPSPDRGQNNRSYNILDLSLQPIKMGLSYAYQRTKNFEDATHFIGFYSSPFLALELKIDLLQLISAYCKIEKVVAKVREFLAKGGSELECYLKLTTGLHLAIGAAYQQVGWSFSAGEDNKLAFGLEGVVSLAFKTSVLFIEIALKASASIKTEAGFALDQHEKGIDLVGYHEGIEAELVLAADIGSDDREEDTGTFSYTERWVVAKSLEADKSKMRISVIGEARAVP